jgi:nucleoside-diphosphate-sugar epimerase
MESARSPENGLEARTRGVAVTGAAGFLGSHLVRGLEARGLRVLPLVHALQARSPAGSRTLDDALASPELLEGLDVVIHAAAPQYRRGGDAAIYRTANVELMERALRTAAAAHVRRFVLLSSVGVYGFPSRLPVTEEHPYAPRTLQAATKVEAEMRARRVARDLGVQLVIVRPTTVYGPGEGGEALGGMVAAIRAGTYRVVGAGENRLHHMHVDDLVEGIWLASTRPEAEGDHFILAGPETTTLEELSARVARALGRPLARSRVPSALARAVATVFDVAAHRGVAYAASEPPVNHEKLDGMTLPLWFDGSKARTRLGFAPRVGYEEGVMRTLCGEWPALARAGAGT